MRKLALMLILVITVISCKKEKLTVCGTVWDKGHDRNGWYLTVDDRQVRVDSVRWMNTEVNSQFCNQ